MVFQMPQNAGSLALLEDDSLAALPPARREAMSGFVAKAYMLRRMRLFEAQMVMRGYAKLKTKVHVFEGESHGSVPPVALIRGLRFVFAEN